MAEGIAGPGFYPQPNEWTCGPFALKHALLALGRMVDVKQLASTARTHWWSGTDEIQLARAAREFECDLVLERRSDPEQARKLLVHYLREQTPVLLCVDEWTHWITVLRAEARRFVSGDHHMENNGTITDRIELVASHLQLIAEVLLGGNDLNDVDRANFAFVMQHLAIQLMVAMHDKAGAAPGMTAWRGRASHDGT